MIKNKLKLRLKIKFAHKKFCKNYLMFEPHFMKEIV